MAKFNEILTGRHNKFLTRLFSMKGPAPAPQLAGEIQPQISLYSGVENRYLESWNRFWGTLILGPSIGNNNGVQLRNPIGSNLLAVMEKLTLFNAGAQTFTLSVIRTAQAALTNVSTMSSLDSRQGPLIGGSGIELSNFSPVANFAITPMVWHATAGIELNEILFEDHEWSILPGDTYRITDTTVNTTSTFIMQWRERSLEESELRQ